MDRTDPTSVYRYYDSCDVLLYVGITKRGNKRNAEHFSKVWWKYVARQEVSHFPTRKMALLEEAKLIASYQPPFNTQLNHNSDASRAAYLEYARKHKATGVDPVKLVGKRWYDGEVIQRRPQMIRIRVDDSVAAYATLGKSVNIPGRSTKLTQCHAVDGGLQLVITRKSGEFGRFLRDVRVNMAIPPEGMRVKSIHWVEGA